MDDQRHHERREPSVPHGGRSPGADQAPDDRAHPARCERGADGAVGTRRRQSLRRPSSTYWVTGSWVAGGWVAGGWAAGGWVAGGWAAGGWVAGRSGKADGQALSMGGTSRQRRPTMSMKWSLGLRPTGPWVRSSGWGASRKWSNSYR